MATEIQRLPGTFKLSAGWPKLSFPNTAGIVADFKASDLASGDYAGDWASSVGSVLLRRYSTTSVPKVLADTNGNKYMKFAATRFSAEVNWAGDYTILAVIRPTLDSNVSGRIVSGGGAGYRRLATASTQGIAVASDKGTAQTVLPGSAATNGKLSAILGRFGADGVDGLTHGQTWSAIHPVSSATTQAQFLVGGGTTDDVSQNYMGDLYRVQVWNRKLAKTDAEAALQIMANTYKF